jgi:hypothetical protein
MEVSLKIGVPKKNHPVVIRPFFKRNPFCDDLATGIPDVDSENPPNKNTIGFSHQLTISTMATNGGELLPRRKWVKVG